MLDQLVAGNPRAISKAISLVEDGDRFEVSSLLKKLYPQTGKSTILGVTGGAGTGKSTLVNQLVRQYRQSDKKVGVIAVDPTSPFTGGAILGDRIRMQGLATDPGVFIRSMATRGRLGGLSAAVNDALLVLQAAGFERIIVETVGVGQDEVDIVKTADVTIVILVPGMGDDIQTIKAGIMEIGDVFVVNKADLDGAARTKREVEALLAMNPEKLLWTPPVLEVVATQGVGIGELAAAVEEFETSEVFCEGLRMRKRNACKERILEILSDRLMWHALSAVSDRELDGYAERVVRRETDPFTVVEELLPEISR